ncbi:hypothetical protein E1292_22365 [Nonomuraea deserti]|uniref:Uncharacterized protein n=1 Tax=Nonomuraea deserti TaxID=1848322 RepID=A0A4R4VJF4_9ACTN|nr:hypothetical protein [Nonomuraea deserti]TDD02973.1 hypothetical protein E1292_22365 [Nonomuraea deserti]
MPIRVLIVRLGIQRNLHADIGIQQRMNVRRLIYSTALAAPVLYAAVNLIALELIAHPTGKLNPWYEEPWNDALLEQLEQEVAHARNVTFGITLILAAEAVLIAVLDRLNHRSPSKSTVPTGVWFILYELTLVVAVLLSPLTRFWLLNDDRDLEMMAPEWHSPALIAIPVLTLIGLIAWMSGPPDAAPGPRDER